MADRNYKIALGLRIRIARLSLGWSCDRLAEAAELSGRAVQLIEHGEGNPTLSTLSQLARALDQDLRDLLPQ